MSSFAPCNFVPPMAARSSCRRSSRSPASDTRPSPAAPPVPRMACSPTTMAKLRTAVRRGLGEARPFGNDSDQSHRSAAGRAEDFGRKLPTRTDRGHRRSANFSKKDSVCWVDHAAWRRVDAAELARAGDGRCRRKFSTVAEMLEAAQVGQNPSCPSATT